jgi:serine/threonine protein kinase
MTMKKSPPPPPPRHAPKSTLTRAPAKRRAAGRATVSHVAGEDHWPSSSLNVTGVAAPPIREYPSTPIENSQLSPRSVICQVPEESSNTFIIKRPNDSVIILTKEKAGLNPLSSNVRSGSDGLLVSDPLVKSSTREEYVTDTNAITQPEEQVNLTFLDITGIAFNEGTSKSSTFRWQQGTNSISDKRKQCCLPTGVQVAITLPSETSHYLYHIPSFPLHASPPLAEGSLQDNNINKIAVGLWDRSNHATLSLSQLMMKSHSIVFLVSLLHNGKIAPFGVATLELSDLINLSSPIEKTIRVQGVALRKGTLANCKVIRMIHSRLTPGEHCTLRIRLDQHKYQQPLSSCENKYLTTTVADIPTPTTCETSPQSEPQVERTTSSLNFLWDRLSIIEDTSIGNDTDENHINNNSSFEVCLARGEVRNIAQVTSNQVFHSDEESKSRSGLVSERDGMDAFEQKFGLTRLMQSIENIGFQILDSVNYLRAPTEGFQPCSVTNELSPSFDEVWRNYEDDDEVESARKSHRNKSASNYSVEDQITPSDMAKHFQGGVGTLVADRYIINRDLGIGTFGRVVACVDMHQQQNEQKVAIKIVRNDVKDIESAQIEADILRHVNSHKDRRGASLCVAMLDHFFFMDGRHYCLVFESLGLSLYDFMKGHEFQPFPLYCIQDFSHQLLDALEFLHSIQLIHTDLKPENILLVSDRVKKYTCCSNNGRATKSFVPESTRIKLIDFGGATFDDEHKSSVINTREYRSPEILLKSSTWSFPSDMWSLGCILAELYTGEVLFLASNKYEHIALIDGVVGPFPKHMIDSSPVAKPFFDSDGRFRRQVLPSLSSQTHVEQAQSLQSMSMNNNNNEESQAFGFLQLLMRLLVIDPCQRATASEAFKLPFSKGCRLNY